MRIKRPKNKIKYSAKKIQDYSIQEIKKVLGNAVADYFQLRRYMK